MVCCGAVVTERDVIDSKVDSILASLPVSRGFSAKSASHFQKPYTTTSFAVRPNLALISPLTYASQRNWLQLGPESQRTKCELMPGPTFRCWLDWVPGSRTIYPNPHQERKKPGLPLGVCRNTRYLESAATQAHDLAGEGAAVTLWTCSVGLMIEDAGGCPRPLSGQGSPVPV